MTDLDPVATTALWMAAERARESARPDRLFDDPLAGRLAGPDGERIRADMVEGMPENPAIPIRTRYVDEGVRAAGAAQVVLFAAGMDTRAYRLDLPAGTVIYELDKPALLDLKERRLGEARPGCTRRAVPTDLAGPWRGDLEAAGFDVREPTVFVAEGLFGYLEEEQVHRLLGTMADLAAPGSVLLADVSGRTPPGLPYLDTWFARLEKAGMSRRFATDDPEGLCAAHGWTATVAQYGEEGANFGRWPFPVVDRSDTGWPHNYLISARIDR